MEPYLEEWDEGIVVDLACGMSRAPRLMEEGSGPYVGLDISPVALRELPGTESECQVEVVQADLENSVPLCELRALYILTFFYSPYLFRYVANNAREGSHVVAETYCAGDEDAPISPKYCLEPGELRSYFSGWDIKLYDERTKDHPETARLVARRSGP